MNWSGKNFVVTGAAGGIGKSLAENLLKTGATVCGIDNDQSSLSNVVQSLSHYGKAFQALCLDVCKPREVGQALNEMKNLDLDYWINCAGIAAVGDFLKISEACFEKLMSVNLGAVIHCTRIALKKMESQGFGTLVNISSVSGHAPVPFMAPYTVSKYALVGFTRALRVELKLRRSPVRVCLVTPGFVDTPCLRKAEVFPEWLNFVLSSTEKVSLEILQGLYANKEEIVPTWSGRWLLRLHRYFPRLTGTTAKLLLCKNLGDFLLNRYCLPAVYEA